MPPTDRTPPCAATEVALVEREPKPVESNAFPTVSALGMTLLKPTPHCSATVTAAASRDFDGSRPPVAPPVAGLAHPTLDGNVT